MKPLVDLHLHLDGSIRLETMLEIAEKEKIALPAEGVAGLKKALRCGRNRASLADYLEAFKWTTAVMQSSTALTRIACELIGDAAADGIRYAEVRFCPLLHSDHGLTPAQAVEAVLEGLRLGARWRNVGSGLILCSMRHLPPVDSERVVTLAKAYRGDVVAVDMAGDDNLPALDHAKHFRWAREKGLHVTIHAGESGPPERIREALIEFQAERIGHGVRLVEDRTLLEALRDQKVPIEACLTSNVQTRTARSVAKHPARGYLADGLCLTLNTDNRMLAETTSTKEFALARKHWRLTSEQERLLIANAIEASFADDEWKAALREELAAQS